MAVTGIGTYSGGTALDVIGGAAGAGGQLTGVASGATGILGGVAMANPYMAAASAVISMLSAPKTDISKAQAMGQSFSGLANFENDDAVSLGGGGVLDFGNPQKVLLMAGAVVLAIYVLKKVKK